MRGVLVYVCMYVFMCVWPILSYINSTIADSFVFHKYGNIYIYIYIYIYIVLVGRVFANDPGDLGSILGRIIPKTLKMILDTSWLNTQQYKVRIKGKVEQSREKSCALPFASV